MTKPRECDGCGCPLEDDEEFYCEDCIYDADEGDEYDDDEEE